MKREITITKRQRLINDVRTWFSKPVNLITVFFFIILFVLIAYPLYAVLSSSVTMGQKDSMMYNSLFKQQLKKGDFSWNNFSMLLSGKYTQIIAELFSGSHCSIA